MGTKQVRGDGGATSYYELPEGATELKHLIKHKKMEHGIGEAFCALYRLEDNGERLRNLKKVLYYIQSEIDYETKEASEESSLSNYERAAEVLHRYAVRRTKERKDFKLSTCSEELSKRISDHAKSSVKGHPSSNEFAWNEPPADELPPSEEPSDEEVRSCDTGRGPSVDRGVPEVLADLARLKEEGRISGFDIQLGYFVPRGVCESVSDAEALRHGSVVRV